MSARDNTAMQALSDAGAQCGNCGDQPGDRICPDCERCYQWYAAALREAGWAPRAEVRAEQAAEIDRLRAELDGVKADLDYLHRIAMPSLRRDIQHHQDGKQRWRDRAEKAEAERDALKQRLHEAAMARVWTNEDGKKFVFADDIKAPLLGIALVESAGDETDSTPIPLHWDRLVMHPDGSEDDHTIVCCMTDDGRPAALFLDDEHREALGLILVDPTGGA